MMKRFFAVCILVCIMTSAGDKIEEFFKSPAQPPEALPAGELYPAGRLFPFGFYSFGGGSDTKRGELLPVEQKIADQNYILKNGCITLIGPSYELNSCVIEDGKRCKLKVAYSVHSKDCEGIMLDGEKLTCKYLDKLNAEKKEPNWEHLKEEVSKIVKSVAENKEIAVWDLAPEELRPWKKMDMKVLKVTAEAVRANDPYHRPLAMYLPNHYGAGSMKPFFPPLDLCWHGMYVNYAGKQESRVWARWVMEQQNEAVKGQAGAVGWALPEMFRVPKKPEDAKLIPAWVRHDSYVALVNGAKGILVFSASRRAKFADCRKIYLDEYLKISRELNGDNALAQMYLFGEKRDDLSFTVIDGPEKLQFSYHKSKGEFPSLSIANIAWKNARYVTIVNSANEKVTVVMDGLPYGSEMGYEEVFEEKPEFVVVAEGNTEIELAPLEVKILKVYCRK